VEVSSCWVARGEARPLFVLANQEVHLALDPVCRGKVPGQAVKQARCVDIGGETAPVHVSEADLLREGM
jgi:hypothetical protein